MKKLLFVYLLFIVCSTLKAQDLESPILPQDLEAIQQLEDTLGLLSFIIINDSIENNRFAACHKFIPTLVEALKHKNSFDYPFKRLQSVSIQYPADSTFRIFTWQLYVDQGLYHYYGAIQMNRPELQLIPLFDRSGDIEEENLEYHNSSNDEWYGSIYYNIWQFENQKGPYYLLFGYDRKEFFHKRKIIDVLYLREGKAYFGAPVFVSDVPTNSFRKSKIVLDYSAEATVGCNYDEFLEMIIFDHLQESATAVPNQGSANLPDGTFEGFKLENGIWKYIPKVFHTVVDEAPRENPILDTRDKNIFGKDN